jgi:DNA-binding response OmpR family regulator
MARILIVEDERHLSDVLRFNLEAEGYEIETVETGEAALEFFSQSKDTVVNAVLLDVMLPGIDGFQVVATLRQRGIFVPVVMLTARGQAEDVLHGFDMGADDYLPKPFELSILFARLKGLLRRTQWTRSAAPETSGNTELSGGTFVFEGRLIDFPNLRIFWKEKEIALTVMEANLLRHLIEREGQVVARKDLLESVWGVREDTDTRAVDNFVVRLRKYLEEEPSQPVFLQTVRGVGYRFTSRGAADSAQVPTQNLR